MLAEEIEECKGNKTNEKFTLTISSWANLATV